MRRQMRKQEIRQPDIVGIEEGNERRVGRGKAVAKSRDLPAILRARQQPQARVANRLEEFADMFGRAVGRASSTMTQSQFR
ncbi:hypothetical protein AJ88_18740 [Mesorhizobium amorphae CCBAU 01583]|nr:hypothetical protein AJ88_18740 [Mesorhizobium amorphae CCBAU 01583]